MLLRTELSRDKVPELPLGICVADTEGAIGYMIQQTMVNSLQKEQIDKCVVTILTQVVVDKDDNAFLWKVESDQVFGDYKVLELKPETIQTDMRRYQYNVLENISNFFINKSEIDCQGVGSLATMEILNLITEKLNEE